MRTINFGNKSFDTKVKLTKGSNNFEVYIPPVRFCPKILVAVPFAIWWNVFIVYWTFGAALIPFPLNIVFVLFSLPFWAAGGYLAYYCLFILFGKIYFRIDRHEVSLIKTIFGVKFSRQCPTPNREITKLIFTRKHFARDSDGDRVERPAALKIEIGAKLLQLGGVQGGIEHEAEVEWLAFEIGEWLDKPLTIIEAPLMS